jgi:phosphoesterase RecJ-like protein
MNDFICEIEKAKTIAVLGHIRPDGDCVGSTLGFYTYIQKNYPEKTVCVYLEPFSSAFNFLNGAGEVRHEYDGAKYDLCVALDCGDTDRFAPFIDCYNSAKRTVCVDHHVSNGGYGDVCYVKPDACSTSEALFDLFDEDGIDVKCAECLYMGIVHDTGVFKHSNTTGKSMTVAGALIDKGARPAYIIDETFYKKTFVQNKLLGYAMVNMELFSQGKVSYTLLTLEDFKRFGAGKLDTDGIVDQLRLTEGCEVAFFMYQLDEDTYKVSLRSNNIVNVSQIASNHCGGGHIRAAGFSMKGKPEDIRKEIVSEIERQL